MLSFTTQNDHSDIFEDNYIDDNSLASIVNSMTSSVRSSTSSALMYPLVLNPEYNTCGSLSTSTRGYSDIESIVSNLTNMSSRNQSRQNSTRHNRYIYIIYIFLINV